ncbi:MAG: cytochrome c1 [Alphaproteobacteria bacterium]|jgi:ubiquinol-cytochrome c reductase cytochrome c1 subunit|nr:cytochrome c1 [Alphaproteobacteria bacterium]
MNLVIRNNNTGSHVGCASWDDKIPNHRSRKRSFCVVQLYIIILLAVATLHAEPAAVPPKQDWSFASPIGTFDRAALQRGFQVYKQVCSACHSIKYISFRHLKALGLSDAEIKVLASQYQIKDGPNDEGEMFERPGRPSDYFPLAYANEKQARAANNGAFPPDLSLIVKARPGGADYVYALLTGFTENPDFKVGTGQYYNAYFSGHAISMAPPLSEGLISYGDGTKATVEQMAHDVTTFLAWASEPEAEERKRLGLKVLMYLLMMTGLFWATMRRIWKNVR